MAAGYPTEGQSTDEIVLDDSGILPDDSALPPAVGRPSPGQGHPSSSQQGFFSFPPVESPQTPTKFIQDAGSDSDEEKDVVPVVVHTIAGARDGDAPSRLKVDRSDATALIFGIPKEQREQYHHHYHPDHSGGHGPIWTIQHYADQFYKQNNMWLFLTLLGILGGISGFANDVSVKYMVTFRTWVMNLLLYNADTVSHYFAWLGWTMLSASIAMFLVWLSPANGAEGSGVAHVKAMLHHWVFTPEIFHWKTYITKLVGLSFSVGCGLWLGKVDVHNCVIICVLLLAIPWFKNINDSQENRYQMLVCASTVGLAVNFGAPLAGLLFGIELCGSYYRSKIYTKAIYVSVLSAFIARLLNSVVARQDHLTKWMNINIPAPGWEYAELPAYVVLGVICGLLGTLFVVLNEQMLKLKKAFGGYRIRWLNGLEFKYVWGMLLVILTATASFPNLFGHFMSINTLKTIEDMGLRDLDAGAGDWTKSIFWSLSVCFVLRYVLSTLLATAPLPGGPYTPFLGVGAVLGRLYIEILVKMFPEWGIDVIKPSYALVAASALTAGATHQRISSALIVMELTGTILVFPLLIATVVSVYVASALHVTLADSIIRMRGWTSYSELKSHQDAPISEIMIKNPFNFITEKCSIQDIAELLNFDQQSSEFAVVDNKQDRRLLGVIDKPYLLSLQADWHKDHGDEAPTRRRNVKASGEAEAPVTPDQFDIGSVVHPVPLTLHESVPLVSLHACVVMTRITTVYIQRKGKYIGVVPISLLKKYCYN